METAARNLAGLLKKDNVTAAMLVPVCPACTRAVSGLAHYIEDEGVPTTQISLIREHTGKMNPPRALWVSFELGRPLGVAGDVAFQTRVLAAAVNLHEAPKRPVLVGYPKDAPPVEGPTALVCPVSFCRPASDESNIAKLSAKFMEEIALMRP